MKQTRTCIFEEVNHRMAEQIAVVHLVLLLPNYGSRWCQAIVKDVSLGFLVLAHQCISHYHKEATKFLNSSPYYLLSPFEVNTFSIIHMSSVVFTRPQ